MRRLAFLLPLALLAPTEAQAESCSVDTEAVLFDPYDTLSGLPSNGVGAVHVTCDGATEVTVALGSGDAGGGVRAMQNGPERLDYELYADPARLVPWGDGAGAAERSATGPDARLTVYGRIPGGPNVPAGPYSDSVVVTVIF
jgi:spore coat protein U-like protein